MRLLQLIRFANTNSADWTLVAYPRVTLKFQKAMGSSAVLLYWQYPMERQKAWPNVSAANPGYHAAASAGFPHLSLGRDRSEHTLLSSSHFRLGNHIRLSTERACTSQLSSLPHRQSEIVSLVKLEKFSDVRLTRVSDRNEKERSSAVISRRQIELSAVSVVKFAYRKSPAESNMSAKRCKKKLHITRCRVKNTR